MKIPILDVPVTASSFDDVVSTVLDWSTQKHRRYVSTCTVYTVMMARQDPSVFEALQRADLTVADGMPLAWYQRYQGQRHAERIYGPDLLLAVCEQTQHTSVRHYFWGGLPDVPEKLVERLQALYPGIQVAGMTAPPLYTLLSEPDLDAVDELNLAEPTIIWVGLGSPKQDLWMALHRPLLNANLLIGVGAAFDFISATKPQAPRWMQRAGLEWLFRLLNEPRRLWKRYIYYNPRFVWALLSEIWQRVRHKSSQG